MRKVLFWVLIVILLFLLVVLGISFWNNKTPLSVLKGRFGVSETPIVEVQEITNGTDVEKTQRDIIRERLEQQREINGTTSNEQQDSTPPEGTQSESSATEPTSPSTTTNTPTRTQMTRQQEEKAAEDFVNNLIQ